MAKSSRSTRTFGEQTNRWSLQNAKARFSEMIRRARNDGPQHVTVYGHDEVVVISTEEFRRLSGDQTGQALIDAFQACPENNLQIEHQRTEMPVREASIL
jgi:prevent-host-death family protein